MTTKVNVLYEHDWVNSPLHIHRFKDEGEVHDLVKYHRSYCELLVPAFVSYPINVFMSPYENIPDEQYCQPCVDALMRSGDRVPQPSTPNTYTGIDGFEYDMPFLTCESCEKQFQGLLKRYCQECSEELDANTDL